MMAKLCQSRFTLPQSSCAPSTPFLQTGTIVSLRNQLDVPLPPSPERPDHDHSAPVYSKRFLNARSRASNRINDHIWLV